MKLSPTWRKVHRRFSFNALGWSAAGLAGWQVLPAEFRAYIGTELAVWVLGLLLVSGMVGSVLYQPSVTGEKPPQE